MARAATSRRRNIPGFGWLTKKKLTHSASSSSKAYQAGMKAGDTGAFDSWLERQRLGEISRGMRQKLEERFRAGVEKGEDRTARSSATASDRRASLAERKERLAEKKLRTQEIIAETKAKAAEKKIATAEHKIAVAEKKLDKGAMAESQFEAMKARMEREIEAQEQHKRAALAKIGNPARSAAQYRLAQAVLSGMARETSMSPKAAREIVDQTPARLRREYSAHNPQTRMKYRLGYNLGQMDRQTASLRRTDGELTANFEAQFPTPIGVGEFVQGYEEGYGVRSGSRRNPEPSNGAPAGPTTQSREGEDEYRQAKKIAELFHGRAVKEEITVTEQIREHDWLWRIGPLVSLKIRTLTKRNATLPFHQSEEGMVHLFCSPDGRQFYLRGGDQELDLNALGMGPKTEWYRDHMVIGECKEITYKDKKKFHKFKLIDYYHKLGEVSKKKPMLAYDAFARKLQIIGGQYRVETKDLVDGMSPGIVN